LRAELTRPATDRIVGFESYIDGLLIKNRRFWRDQQPGEAAKVAS